MTNYHPSKGSAVKILAELASPERDDPVDAIARYESVRVVAEIWRAHSAKIAQAVWYERHPTLDPLVRAKWYETLLFPLGAPHATTEEKADSPQLEKRVPPARRGHRGKRGKPS